MQHKWHITFEPDVPRQIKRLSFADGQAVFRSMRELLVADNPSLLIDVKKLTAEDFNGIPLWRKRQGVYRIKFTIQSAETEYRKQIFKGVIHIVSVDHRRNAY